MDPTAILTTLWGKISKPTPNILIGAVFLTFAPEDWNWIGYVFLAIGVSSIIEWLWKQLNHLFDKLKTDTKLKAIFSSLNNDEKRLLGRMLHDNEQTISINYHDYRGGFRAEPRLGNYATYVQLFGVCSGLGAKDILSTFSFQDITTFSVRPDAWKVMQKLIKIPAASGRGIHCAKT